MRISNLFCLVLTVLAINARAQTKPTPEQEAFFNKLMGGINARHVKWVKTTAIEVNAKKLSEADVKQKANGYAGGGVIDGQDIEALCFLVLMQASKSAQEDLKDMMEKLKSINNQKAKQREFLSKMQQQKSLSPAQLDSFYWLRNKTLALQKGASPDTVKLVRTLAPRTSMTKQELDRKVDQIKNDLDSMSEMGEMESLRLQMAMDRMSKMMSTLSNILKKISKTADAITQNLK